MISNIDYPLKNKYYKHLFFCLVLPVYLIFYTIAERIVVDNYWVSHMPLDDVIPFCEYFIIPYVFWYLFMFVTGIYLMYRNSRDFSKFMLYIAIGFYSTLIFCLIFPNGQDLRPETFTHSNIFTWIIGIIYSADTNTNVLPSMHVIGSMGVVFAVYNCRAFDKKHLLKALTIFFACLISISTVFVKQHSVLDTIVAIPWAAAAYAIVYLPNNIRRHRNKA